MDSRYAGWYFDARRDVISYDPDSFVEAYTTCRNCGKYLIMPSYETKHATCQTNVKLVILEKRKAYKIYDLDRSRSMVRKLTKEEEISKEWAAECLKKSGEESDQIRLFLYFLHIKKNELIKCIIKYIRNI